MAEPGGMDHSWWRSQAEDPSWLSWCKLGMVLTVVLFLAMQLTGGVVRWGLDMMGAAVLTYVPNIWMLLGLLVVVGTEFLYARLKPLAFIFLIWMALCLTVGYFNTGRVSQSLFGLWVLLPFLFGLSAGPVLMQSHPLKPKFYMALFAVAAGGVLAHSFLSLPWVGVSYQVGGVELEGAREWHASGGVQRLSGLARSSFDVAGQIIVASGLLSLHVRRLAWRILLWSLCAYAISLSTSKGILLTLLMTWVSSECLLHGRMAGLKSVFVLGIAWLMLPPLLGWTMDWSEAARVDIHHPLYGSFIDRMNDMWPRALDLATDHGVPLLGRGLGGIGVPLSVFEPDLANAGDNLWVYTSVLSGVVCLPFFILGYVQIFKFCCMPMPKELQEVMILLVMVNWYGGVSNILEHAVLALAFGIACRYLVSPNFRLDRRIRAEF
jgi:hypothetical protein